MEFQYWWINKKIYICKNLLYSICIWDNDTLFISSYDKKLRLINLNSRIIIFGKKKIKMWIVSNQPFIY